MDIKNNENLENEPEITNDPIAEPVIVVNSATQEKPSDQPAIISLVLGIIGSIISIGIGGFFIGMLLMLIGLVFLAAGNTYLILCSAVATVGLTLGITSIVLGSKHVKYHKVISIFGIILGSVASVVGILDLMMFYWFYINF